MSVDDSSWIWTSHPQSRMAYALLYGRLFRPMIDNVINSERWMSGSNNDDLRNVTFKQGDLWSARIVLITQADHAGNSLFLVIGEIRVCRRKFAWLRYISIYCSLDIIVKVQIPKTLWKTKPVLTVSKMVYTEGLTMWYFNAYSSTSSTLIDAPMLYIILLEYEVRQKKSISSNWTHL